jgi:hypothetical protein
MNCPTGKVEHQTVTAAQAHADSIFRKDGHQPNVYVCSQCGFFHVGGGRASDRPAYRPVLIVTSPKPVFVQRKIDKGRSVSVKHAILEQLRRTTKGCPQIAAEFGTTKWIVDQIRLKNNIPTQAQRIRDLVKTELSRDPQQCKTKLAEKLRLPVNTIFNVARENGLPHRRLRGPKHHNFGKRASLTTKAKMSRPAWNKGKACPQIAAAMKGKKRPDMSTRMKGRNGTNLGKKFSEETKQRMREARNRWWAGRVLSEETRQRMREAHLGKKRSADSARLKTEAVV